MERRHATPAQAALLADVRSGDRAPFVRHGFGVLDECLRAGWVAGIDDGDRITYYLVPEGRAALEWSRVPAWATANPEWAAALHLLTGPALHNKGCLAAVDFDRQRIDFPGFAKRAVAWSHGERILFCAAWALFNGGERRAFAELLDGDLLSEAVATLDTGNLRRLLEAVRLRRPDAERR